MLSEALALQDGKWNKEDEEASLERGASKSSPQCIISEQVPQIALRMYLFALRIRYPCSAAEGQIAMAIFCRKGQIL